ncbi:amidohydrolase family protein [Bifidobacterium callitrichidarum]|nr:amidohydrolase family protein [Bifidobacterium callitrichidarum]
MTTNQYDHYDNQENAVRYLSKIDFQSHYLPPAYLDFLKRHYPGDPDGYPTPDYWTMDWQRDKMRLLGVAYAHLMLSSPNIWLPDAGECLDLARRINDQGAGMAAEDPAHFGLIATLPLPYERESIVEARRALDELHADGVGLTTNHHGCYLGDPRLDGLMRELDARGALAIIHPTAPAVLVPDVCEGLSLPAFEYFVETTRAFTNMVMHDTFVRFPNIRWVLPHAARSLRCSPTGSRASR